MVIAELGLSLRWMTGHIDSLLVLLLLFFRGWFALLITHGRLCRLLVVVRWLFGMTWRKGLLNHISALATVSLDPVADVDGIERLLGEFGAFPASAVDFMGNSLPSRAIAVLCDGRVVGFVEDGDRAAKLTNQLRQLKVEEDCLLVPRCTEIAYVPRRHGGLYPGVFLFTSPARLLRPVKWLRGNHATPPEELIGTFEQGHLRIRSAIRDDDGMENEEDEDAFSHEEVLATGILSVLASMTPFSDMNQSPRNMYQCQMGKQALGTPCHMYHRRSESKTYRLLTGQVPITRNRIGQDVYGMDVFPNGTNAVVAVLSYTGYDMEDAMVINKASLDRGFCQGYVYATTTVNLDDMPGGLGHEFTLSPQPNLQSSYRLSVLENFTRWIDRLPFHVVFLICSTSYSNFMLPLRLTSYALCRWSLAVLRRKE